VVHSALSQRHRAVLAEQTHRISQWVLAKQSHESPGDFGRTKPPESSIDNLSNEIKQLTN
jgi:hypothetical protein